MPVMQNYYVKLIFNVLKDKLEKLQPAEAWNKVLFCVVCVNSV